MVINEMYKAKILKILSCLSSAYFQILYPRIICTCIHLTHLLTTHSIIFYNGQHFEDEFELLLAYRPCANIRVYLVGWGGGGGCTTEFT